MEEYMSQAMTYYSSYFEMSDESLSITMQPEMRVDFINFMNEAPDILK